MGALDGIGSGWLDSKAVGKVGGDAAAFDGD